MLRRYQTNRDKQSYNRFLLLRNLLNIIFMLIAAIGMVGMVVYPSYSTHWQILCLLAVCIKMVEVMFRMPGIKK